MKRVSTLIGISIMLIGGAWPSVCRADLWDGVVAYYPFSGNANDVGVYGNHGIVYGNTVLTVDRHGSADSAYYFDGYGDYIRASANNLPTAERTVAFWLNADTVDNRPVLLGYGGGGYGTSWLMGIQNSGIYKCWYMSSHYGVNTIYSMYGENPPIQNWYYFAVTTDSEGTRLYVNGELRESNSNFVTNTLVAGTDLAIGVAVAPNGQAPYTDVNSGYMKGTIDEVGIWDRALSLTEIQQLMQTDLSMVPVPGAVLLGIIGLSVAGIKLRRYA